MGQRNQNLQLEEVVEKLSLAVVFEIEGEAFMLASHDDDEPKNVKEALNSPKKDLWIKAMEEEMESMKSNHV